MMGKTHIVLGGAAWLAGYALFAQFHWNQVSLLELSAGWGISGLGALAPDIDSPKSLITKSLGPLTKLLSIVIIKIGAIGDPHRGYMRGHRRLTHSLLGCLLPAIPLAAGILFWRLQPWVAYAFMAGWASHILADMTTLMGCPILWPRDHCYGLHKIKTGSLWETHIIRPSSVFLNIALVLLAMKVI